MAIWFEREQRKGSLRDKVGSFSLVPQTMWETVGSIRVGEIPPGEGTATSSIQAQRIYDSVVTGSGVGHDYLALLIKFSQLMVCGSAEDILIHHQGIFMTT